MRVLIDHYLNWRLKRSLPDHQVSAAFEMGWEATQNGKLLDLAESQFDIFPTADRNIPSQQNFSRRTIVMIVLAAPSNRLQDTQPLMPQVNALLPTVEPGHVYIIKAEPEPE